ncbi:MAG: hypothetical protein M5U01_09955 [Ardenticatenaceae bacterium]|nr:hypothetical protein [Ardenticatenaceae bacterium]
MVIVWDEGPAEPWLIVTDLAPGSATADREARRVWIEPLLKTSTCSGWHWEQIKMIDPAHAQRLRVAMAVGTLWGIRHGTDPARDLLPTPLTDAHAWLPTIRPTCRTRLRCLSCVHALVLHP